MRTLLLVALSSLLACGGTQTPTGPAIYQEAVPTEGAVSSPSSKPTASDAAPPADAGPAATSPTDGGTISQDTGLPGFPPDEIRKVVMANMAAIRACYEAGLSNKPSLAGTVTLGWHITPAGKVTNARILSSSLQHPGVEECFVRSVRGWVFRNPDAVEADASWGFKFTPP